MVLSDVVEADDNYTANHCRSVVELAVATADELGLGSDERQELETAALLHDVGKIAIPKEILNKPAKLTDEEFELMKSHTIEGQALLDRVGGQLARVGEIVRSCHERWDGHGYPDGLRGEEIPLAARIVFCCDAYSRDDDRPALPRGDGARRGDRRAARERRHAVRAARRRGRSAVVEADRARPDDARYADAVRAVLASNSEPALEPLRASPARGSGGPRRRAAANAAHTHDHGRRPRRRPAERAGCRTARAARPRSANAIANAQHPAVSASAKRAPEQAVRHDLLEDLALVREEQPVADADQPEAEQREREDRRDARTARCRAP